MASAASLSDTLTAILCAGLVSTGTCGIVFSQGYTYYRSFPNDRLVFKLVVTYGLLLALLQTIFSSYWCWSILVAAYGDPTVLAIVGWPITALIFMIGCSTTLAQGFFAWRLWKISDSRNWWLPGLALALSLLQFGAVLWVGAYLVQNPSMAAIGGVLRHGADSALPFAPSSIAKTLLAISPNGYLWLTFVSICKRAIQNNVLSLLVQVVSLVMFKTNTGLWFYMLDDALVKTYIFSIIISMTARRAQVSSGTSGDDSDFAASVDFRGRSAMSGSKARKPPGLNSVQVTVQQETHHAADEWQASNLPQQRMPVSVTFGDAGRDHVERKRRDEELELDSL